MTPPTHSAPRLARRFSPCAKPMRWRRSSRHLEHVSLVSVLPPPSLNRLVSGHQVTDTMRKGVLDLSAYNGTNSAMELIYGQISILSGCGMWMLIATAMKLPVSTTHSIVGATIGFSLVIKGSEGIRWRGIIRICESSPLSSPINSSLSVISWIVSPLLSGFVSVIFYVAIDHFVLRRVGRPPCPSIVLSDSPSQ